MARAAGDPDRPDKTPPGTSESPDGRPRRRRRTESSPDVRKLADLRPYDPDAQRLEPPYDAEVDERSPRVSASQLVGRRGELDELGSLLQSRRVVTLTGTGGVGKTRLADAASVAWVAAGGERSWFVELADIVDPALVPVTVCSALGFGARSSGHEIAQLAGSLGSSTALVVLDNCEHLIEAVAAVVTELTERCPGIRVLATSREPLGVRAEVVCRVHPLPLPPAGDRTPQTLERTPSIELFVERVRAAWPEFCLTADNAEAVVDVVSALDGLPLALELAAARTRLLSITALRERLHDRFGLLLNGQRDAPARHQSLAASISWTYDLCTPLEQLLWSRLCVFAGGFTLAGAERVCSGDDLDPAQVLDALGALIDKSVVTRAEDGERYFLLDSLREYGLAKAGREELRAIESRRDEWMCELVASMRADWVSPRQAQWLKRIGEEHPNLRATLDNLTATPEEAPKALRMCIELEPFWLCGMHFSEARQWIGRAVSHGTGGPGLRALALRVGAYLATLVHDFDDAQAQLDQASPLVEAADDPAVQGSYLFGCATLATWAGRNDEGIRLILDALQQHREARWLLGEINKHMFTGLALTFAGRDHEAAPFLHECVAMCTEHGEVFIRSYARWLQGINRLSARELQEAEETEQDALRMAWQLNNLELIALIFEALAWIAAAAEDAVRYAELHGAAARLWESIGVPLTLVPALARRREAAAATAADGADTRALTAATRRGRGWTLAHALEVALAGPHNRARISATGPLTHREYDVALLIAEGLSNREIAKKLVISERTVHGHIENILRRLGVRSRVQIALWVVERAHTLDHTATIEP